MRRSLSRLSFCVLAGLTLVEGVATSAAGGRQDEAQKAIAGPIEARVVKVRDGDTVEVEAFIWPMQSVRVAVRLKGIDAPETRARCASEKIAAERATDRLVELVGPGPVYLSGISGDKYFGRVLARLSTKAESDLGATLLSEGLVGRYEGGKRRDWCADVLSGAASGAPSPRGAG